MSDNESIDGNDVTDDEYDLDELPFDEDDEEGEGDSGSGKGGGKSPKRYRVIVEPFLDFADDPNLSPEENAERKLRLLALTPNSILVPGASSFASENDLSRKIFMVDVGQANGEASGSDIADPDFVDKRDALQRKRRTMFGLPHPSLVLSGGIALASTVAAAFAGFSNKAMGKDAKGKLSKKGKSGESQKKKLLDFSLDKDSAFAAKDDPYKSDPALGEVLSSLANHVTIETVTETVEVQRTALSFDNLPSYFNYLSEIAKTPVVKVDLKDTGKGGKSGNVEQAPTSPWQEYTPIK